MIRIKSKVEWVKRTGKYQGGEWAYVGKIRVGYYDWDNMRSRDDPMKYRLYCTLPEINPPGSFESPEKAKERMQAIVDQWFAATQKERA